MSQGEEYKPTKEDEALIRKYANEGMPAQLICYKLGKFTSVNTLKKYFAKVLDQAKLVQEYEMGKNLYTRGKEGDNTAAIFWLKTQCPDRWRETQHIVQENAHKFISNEVLSDEMFEKKYLIDDEGKNK
jgi:hypothetical protein